MVAGRLVVGSGRCGRVPHVGVATATSAIGGRDHRWAARALPRTGAGSRCRSAGSARTVVGVGCVREGPAGRARTPWPAAAAPPERTDLRPDSSTRRIAAASGRGRRLRCGLRPPSDLWLSSQHQMINGGRPGLPAGPGRTPPGRSRSRRVGDWRGATGRGPFPVPARQTVRAV
jgi:hypothetical protein